MTNPYESPTHCEAGEAAIGLLEIAGFIAIAGLCVLIGPFAVVYAVVRDRPATLTDFAIFHFLQLVWFAMVTAIGWSLRLL